MESLVNDFPDVIYYQSILLSSSMNLTISCINAYRYMEAAQAGRRYTELGEKLARDHPEVPQDRDRLLKLLDMLADLSSCFPEDALTTLDRPSSSHAGRLS